MSLSSGISEKVTFKSEKSLLIWNDLILILTPDIIYCHLKSNQQIMYTIHSEIVLVVFYVSSSIKSQVYKKLELMNI